MSKRWIGLTRVSTSGQVTDGDGLETQEHAIERWVKRRGDRLVRILADEGVPGTFDALPKRLALADALQRVNKGEADGIVVYKLDRLSRELGGQEMVLYQMRKMGAPLASCDPSENDALEGEGSDPGRRMFRQVLGVFAEYERGMITARCQAGRANKAAKGGYLGSPVPYGFELDGNGGLRDHPGELSAIAQARTMRARGATYNVLGEFLASSGVRLRRGTRWHPQVVKTVLVRASEQDYPPAAPIGALGKLLMGLPVLDDEV